MKDGGDTRPSSAPGVGLGGLAWPRARAAEALWSLAERAGAAQPAALTDPEVPLVDVARAQGLDVDPFDLLAPAPLGALRRGLPAIVELSGGGLLAIRACGATWATIQGPAGATRVPVRAIEDVLWAATERGATGSAATPAAAAATRVVDAALGPGARADDVRRAWLGMTIAGRPLAQAWTLDRPSASLRDALRKARVSRRLVVVVAALVLQMALLLAIWRSVGARALGPARGGAPGAGVLDGGGATFAVFAALLGGWVVAEVGAAAAFGRLALDAGAALRQWFTRGLLRLDPERIRSAGAGQLLGRALDAEALDALVLGGGAQAIAGVIDLGFGAVVLAVGVAPGATLVALGLAVGLLVGGTVVHARRHGTWSGTRRALTHDLVERMVGHRTALIQDRPAARARQDDAALAAYDRDTRKLDRVVTWLGVGLPRGWLVAGLALVAYAAGPAAPIAGVAASVGGVFLVCAALGRLTSALPMLAEARTAWLQVAPLARTPPEARAAAPTEAPVSGTPGDAGARELRGEAPLLVADALGYGYPGRARAVLDGASLTVAWGDRVLIQGASGGGKSTLASLLTGLLDPASGRLALRGVDQRRLGLAAWRRAVGAAPQFHDNHVFGAELLFNLLMGRRWPPRADDVTDAERVCRELGLGPLLARMPAGLQQLVGETGWQLSHGERSRLYVARTLLQALDARVLDESFAALDPETLDEVMAAVLRRPEALIVIAHP